MIKSMGGPIYTILIVFIGSQHKKEAWNLSGFYKKAPNNNAKELKSMVKQLEKVTGRRVAKSMLHKSHESSKTEE